MKSRNILSLKESAKQLFKQTIKLSKEDAEGFEVQRQPFKDSFTWVSFDCIWLQFFDRAG